MIIGPEMRRHSNRQRRWEMTGYAFDGASDDALAVSASVQPGSSLSVIVIGSSVPLVTSGKMTGCSGHKLVCSSCNTGGAMRQYLIMRHSRPLLGCTEELYAINAHAMGGASSFSY